MIFPIEISQSTHVGNSLKKWATSVPEMARARFVFMCKCGKHAFWRRPSAHSLKSPRL